MSPFRSACIVRHTCYLLAACGVRVPEHAVARWTAAEREAVLAWTDAYLTAAYSDVAADEMPPVPAVLAEGVGAAPVLGRRGPQGAGAADVVTADVAAPHVWRRA